MRKFREWLTTGEMIDRLHVGQTAEGFIETERGPIKRIEVTKNDAHSIMVIDSWTVFEATGINLSYKWRILPKYVRFEEAMKAYAEGKTIRSYCNGESKTYNINDFDVLTINVERIRSGKWTIEEEK